MERLLQYLGSIHPMSEGCRERVLSILRMKELSSKELLLRAGYICQHIYFIQRAVALFPVSSHLDDSCSRQGTVGHAVLVVNWPATFFLLVI